MLHEIVAHKREELADAPADLFDVVRMNEDVQKRREPLSLSSALRPAELANIIAEVKRRSPSAGTIADRDPVEQARLYASGGASAISVLTDTHYFGGSAADLTAVANANLGIPVLRKDFIVDDRQILQSRAIGADALLLIVAALERAVLVDLLAQTRELGMEALVEVHTKAELEVALATDATVIGINNRDLHSFTTELSRTQELAPLVGDDRIVVAESGIKTPSDIALLRRSGAHTFLVGETLMRSDDPAKTLTELRSA